MAAITSAGLGSGIDIDLLVTTLANAERAPVENRLNLRETQVQASVTAFNSLRGSLNDLQSSLSGLTRLQDFSTRTASSSDTDVFTATATSSAVPASVDVRVEKLAQAHKLVSNSGFADLDTAVGAGTLAISVGSESFSVTITGGENNSLAGIRDAINEAEDNTGVTASILTVDDPGNPGEQYSKLVLTATNSGADSAIKVTVTDVDLNDTDNVGLSQLAYDPDLLIANMTELTEAQDAEIYVDGFLTTNSTNVFEGVVQGVTLNILSADPGVTHQLSVAVDNSAVKSKLSDFVEAYNTFLEEYKFLTDYDSEENEAGLLTGDSTARSIMTRIQRTLGAIVEGGTANYTGLSRIGITLKEEGEGRLELDSSTLSSALNDDFDAVANLISGTEGIMTTLDSEIDAFVESGGILAARDATFKTQLEDIEEQREALELRISSVEERLRQQFTAMDIIVAQFKSTGDFITQQMDSINPANFKK
jgi:flagellar hook-associated protein 2